ncbi:MAG: molybdenum cofactor biosynthesis protein MoaE [Acidobacteria bacterium]|nr:molybdenum cofactor biosynthesis protein MoaE [Acidobacteriota bacterium]
MQVKVLFFGSLKEIVGRPEEVVSLEEGGNIGRLYDQYALRFPRLAECSSSILFSRNREFAGLAEPLQDGDEVAFLPPVSGGSSGALKDAREELQQGNIILLTREPISAEAVVKKLRQDEDGAIVSFEGVVRNHSGQRATLFLEYEAYGPMALGKMGEIVAEVKRKFEIARVGIVHRLGRLEIGEASVVIVITAAHRALAFDACHYAIDRLKQIVPIWKKEFFAGGAAWGEGEGDRHLGAAL